MDWNEFYSILWSCVGLVLTGLTSWGLARLIAWLNSKIKDDKTKNYMAQLSSIVSKAILYAEQTFVSQLKKAGSWSDANYKEALEVALAEAKSQLTTELSAWIKDNGYDITTYLTQQIEAQIGASKTNKTSTTVEESGE